MAPALKGGEVRPETNPSSPDSSGTKSPADSTARIQPVALEIPVTVNGARTVEGSGRREPFSEATRTVLVFPQGAVIRSATPLSAGQLVFLTNEKTKKEVVCQVLKSKAGASSNGYVELRFTENAGGFWGVRFSGTPAPASLGRPTVPAPLASPKKVQAPALPAQPVKRAAVTPVVAAPPVKPEPAPLSEVAKSPEPTLSQLLLSSAPPPAPLPLVQEPAPVSQDSSSLSAQPAVPPIPSVPPASEPPVAAVSSPPAPPPVKPSERELKLFDALLQASPVAIRHAETSAPVVPLAVTDSPIEDVADRVLEFSHEQSTAAPLVVPQPSAPAKPFLSPPFSAEEEVEIPAWLAPLSQNAEPSSVASVGESPSAESSAENASGSSDLPEVAATSQRSEAVVFGGQLLGEAGSESPTDAPRKSRAGLILGFLAAALLLAAAWYFRNELSGLGSFFDSKPAHAAAPTKQSYVAPEALTAPVTSEPSTDPVTQPDLPSRASAPAIARPSRNPAPYDIPSRAVALPTARNSLSSSEDASSAAPLKKSPLADVRLASPVVNRPSASAAQNDNAPSIDTRVAAPGQDAFAAVTAVHHKEPAMPIIIGGDVKTAQLIKAVPPEYPPMAKSQHVSGTVVIDALIDESGSVSEERVLSGPSLLHRAALDAVKKWKYSPALLDGKPTSIHLSVTVQFRAQ